MPYSAEVSVTHGTPTCLLFLIDQSASMQDTWSKDGKPKSQAVAIAINRLLDTVVLRCTKNEGVRDYFDIGVIGYGPGNLAKFAWTGKLMETKLVPVSKLRDSAEFIKIKKKIDAGDGTLLEREVDMPQWFLPVADNGTPMDEAFRVATETLKEWISKYPYSFPPIVFNITDGEPNNPQQAEIAAAALINLATLDGNVLLFNVHISGKQGQEIVFPDNKHNLPDDYARMLFNISSPLPDPFRFLAAKEGMTVTERSRGFVFNADAVKLIEFIDIGTRVQNLR